MLYKHIGSFWIPLIVILKIRYHNAQQVNSTGTATVPVVRHLDSGYYNPGSDERGNSNVREPGYRNWLYYPENTIPSFGNQGNFMPGPQQGNGWTPQNPNLGGYYPGSPYQPNYPGLYPQNPNNFRPGTSPFNPNYQRHYPPRPGVSRPNNVLYPGNVNRPYINGRIPNQGGNPNRPQIPINHNQPQMPINHNQPSGMPDDIRYFPHGGQYPPQDNPNVQSGGQGPNYQPNYNDNINNIPDSNDQYPGTNGQGSNQGNQYPSQGGLENHGNVNIRPNGNNNYPLNNDRYSPNSQDSDDGSIRFPNKDSINLTPVNTNVPSAINLSSNPIGAPQSQLLNNQQFGSVNVPNANNTATILGKPVFIPSAMLSPGKLTFGGN